MSRKQRLLRYSIGVTFSIKGSNGRKTVIPPKLIAEVQHLKEEKDLSITQIAKITEQARTTIYYLQNSERGVKLHTI